MAETFLSYKDKILAPEEDLSRVSNSPPDIEDHLENKYSSYINEERVLVKRQGLIKPYSKNELSDILEKVFDMPPTTSKKELTVPLLTTERALAKIKRQNEIWDLSRAKSRKEKKHKKRKSDTTESGED